MPARKGPSIFSFARLGFGFTLGSVAVFMLSTLFAMIFFIPGYIILNREQKKPKEEQSQSMKILGFVLMGLGVIVGLGFGAGAFLEEISQEL